MSLRFPNGAFSRDKTFSSDKLDAVVMALDRAIHELEAFKFDAQEQVTLFNTNALKRVADAVQPIFEQLRTAVDGGFLVAETNDLVEIVEGEEVSFFIPEAARIAFRPTPFLAILAPDVREDWAIGRLLVYNDVTGLLKVEILHLNGSGAERTGWTVAASSGVVEAVYQWMTEITAMRDEVVAKLAEVTTHANNAATNAADALSYKNAAQTAAGTATGAAGAAAGFAEDAETSATVAALLVASIEGGPVATVNTRPGPHVTGLAEAADVATALAERDATIETKADKSDTYTKTQVDDAVKAAQDAASGLASQYKYEGFI
jgi:hypothetical protein